jgi:hypothetical protein
MVLVATGCALFAVMIWVAATAADEQAQRRATPAKAWGVARPRPETRQASMTTEQEQSVAALEQHIAEIRARTILLKARHDAARAEMRRYTPAPGSTPTRRAWRKFAKYVAETAAVLAARIAAPAARTNRHGHVREGMKIASRGAQSQHKAQRTEHPNHGVALPTSRSGLPKSSPRRCDGPIFFALPRNQRRLLRIGVDLSKHLSLAQGLRSTERRKRFCG